MVTRQPVYLILAAKANVLHRHSLPVAVVIAALARRDDEDAASAAVVNDQVYGWARGMLMGSGRLLRIEGENEFGVELCGRFEHFRAGVDSLVPTLCVGIRFERSLPRPLSDTAAQVRFT